MDTVRENVDELTAVGYQHVLESGGWDAERLSQLTGASAERLREAQQHLRALHLIEPDHRDGGWHAVSPRVAMAKLVAPIDAEVYRQATRADDLRRRMQVLLPLHSARHGAAMWDAVEVVGDGHTLHAVLTEEAARSTTSLLVMTGGPEPTDQARTRYLDARRRGVCTRTVLRHSARYDLPVQGFVEILGAAGALFRTADELPVQVQIADRSSCVLIVDPADGTDAAGVILRHPVVVSMLTGVFEQTWTRATAFTAADPQPMWVGNELRRSILRMLADGAKDDAIARRLGISIRTCRRHVADLTRALGAASRFQAGVEAQRRHLV